MVNQKDAIDRLRKEAEYEERLAINILEYCKSCKESITDVDEATLNIIHERFDEIRNDSLKHEEMFKKLITMVIDKGEADY